MKSKCLVSPLIIAPRVTTASGVANEDSTNPETGALQIGIQFNAADFVIVNPPTP